MTYDIDLDASEGSSILDAEVPAPRNEALDHLVKLVAAAVVAPLCNGAGNHVISARFLQAWGEAFDYLVSNGHVDTAERYEGRALLTTGKPGGAHD